VTQESFEPWFEDSVPESQTQPLDLVIVERDRHWGALCDRALSPGVVKLWECRSMQEVESHLASRVWPMVGVNVEFGPWPQLFRWIARLSRCHHAPIVLLGQAVGGEWHLREAGATAWMRSVLDLPRLELLIRRHALRLPPSSMTWHERVWAEMPWRKYEQKAK
jgi:hypothetical protein